MLIEPTERVAAWLVVRTKPLQERIAAEHFGKRRVEAYCPRIVEPPRHRRAPRGPVPLFPGYVFAHCVPFVEFNTVHYCPGVLGVVRFGGWLAAVQDGVIAGFHAREDEGGVLRLGRERRGFVKGERVRVTAGHLNGFEGVVTRYMPAADRVRLLLALVSGPRKVEVDASHVVHC
jgi:transcription antitermination factor NusG